MLRLAVVLWQHLPSGPVIAAAQPIFVIHALLRITVILWGNYNNDKNEREGSRRQKAEGQGMYILYSNNMRNGLHAHKTGKRICRRLMFFVYLGSNMGGSDVWLIDIIAEFLNHCNICFKILLFRLAERITLIDKNLYRIKIKFSSRFRNFTKGGDNISSCLYLL